MLTGNDFYDLALRDEIAAGWTLSPYEFCTLEEFNSLKYNDEYYFLITADGKFKKENEPGLTFLTLIKGGKGASEGINKMLEVVSLPIASAENPSGREFVFMPAIIILQKTIQFDIYIVESFVLLVDNLLEVILKRIFIIIAVIIVVLLVIILIREFADVLLN